MVLMIVRTEGFFLSGRSVGGFFRRLCVKGFLLASCQGCFFFGRLIGFLSQKTTHEFCFCFIVLFLFSPFSEGFL